MKSNLPKPSQKMLDQVTRFKNKEILLTDYHIHIRGGMSFEKALDWAQKTNIRSSAIENYGKDWPLSNDTAIRAFIEAGKKFPELLLGIQVNDRDWYQVIDHSLLSQLDFVISDTMVMDGQKLWLENDYSTKNEEAWLNNYYAHCLQILNEPITIYSNPLYLPNKMMHHYESFWTTQRQTKIIETAVKNKIAIEIQSKTQFPHFDFMKLAMQKGAKVSIGRNNHDDSVDELERSLDWLEELCVKQESMLDL
jgi:hypothetical protein